MLVKHHAELSQIAVGDRREGRNFLGHFSPKTGALNSPRRPSSSIKIRPSGRDSPGEAIARRIDLRQPRVIDERAVFLRERTAGQNILRHPPAADGNISCTTNSPTSRAIRPARR